MTNSIGSHGGRLPVAAVEGHVTGSQLGSSCFASLLVQLRHHRKGPDEVSTHSDCAKLNDEALNRNKKRGWRSREDREFKNFRSNSCVKYRNHQNV